MQIIDKKKEGYFNVCYTLYKLPGYFMHYLTRK